MHVRGHGTRDKNESVCDLTYDRVASELSFDHVFMDYKLGLYKPIQKGVYDIL